VDLKNLIMKCKREDVHMEKILQILQMLLATIFIILTLGFVSIELEWTDGTRFRYTGWKRRK